MYDYRAYGLHVRSALPLPTLRRCCSGEGRADVYVYPGPLPPPRQGERGAAYYARSDERGAYYFVEGLGGLLAREGREIVVDPIPGGAHEAFHHLVAGIGMGLVLHQRGAFSLHASAVAVGGGAVAFVGWKGMGKSTTAAAFYSRGYPVVTDDLLVVRCEDAGVSVEPGLSGLKLLPEAAAEVLGDLPDALPRLHPDMEKRLRDTHAEVDHGESGAPAVELAPAPLLAVYLLDYAETGTPARLEALSTREAYIELIRHAFALRILGDAGDAPHLFGQREHLVHHVPFRRLYRERRLQVLPDLVAQVEEDVASIRRSNRESVPAGYAPRG